MGIKEIRGIFHIRVARVQPRGRSRIKFALVRAYPDKKQAHQSQMVISSLGAVIGLNRRWG
jgi:hypothetical protein